MRISDIHSAKGLKFKLNFISKPSLTFLQDGLVRISRTTRIREFNVEPFGQTQEILLAAKDTADYIEDLLRSEEQDIFHCLFVIEGVNNDSIEIQTYRFNSLVEYKTPIVIKASQSVLEKNSLEQLKKMFVWEGFSYPVIFSLRYKNSVKNKADVRLLSDKCFLYAMNTARGLIALAVKYAKDKSDMPVDVYIAPSIDFIKEMDDGRINDELSHDLERITNANTYFTRWEAYNELAERQVKNEAKEFGEVSYDGYNKITGISGTHFEFTIINNEAPSDYSGAELAVLIDDDVNQTDVTHRKAQKVRIGQFINIKKNNTLVTFKDDIDSVTLIPPQGKIVLSTSGDETIIRRRNLAKQRMLVGRSPIKSIVRLIEEGVSEFSFDSNWGSNKAITQELLKNFKEAKDFNENQEAALDIAINTPDIALIQGPPGTGKTLVIKAICERFREIFEAHQKQLQKHDPDYETQRPKILISSFQNEAVDNAISKPLPGDLPAYRIGRKNSEQQYKKSLEAWYVGVKNDLENKVGDTAALAYIEQKRKLSDEFFVYKNSDEPIGLAIGIIEKYLSFAEIPYPCDLKQEANIIVAGYKKRGRIADDIVDPIVDKLKAQRLIKGAFLDDGVNNARRLVAHLKNRDDLNISPQDIDAILAVCSTEIINDEAFEKYVEVVTRLSAEYCPKTEKVDLTNKAKIERCILELAYAFSNGYLSATDDLEVKKSLIIGEFLDRFENEYDEMVAKYSFTTAATCQGSLQLSGGNEDETYDLVIIDEAARATPLDLFIPMSMGRKVILVGDHKQLPHMLEPDVLKLIMDDPRYKDLPDIAISLFERLYNMFSKGIRPKAIQLNMQYRMHPDICKFVSDAFYDSTLKPGISAEDRPIPKELSDGKALVYTNIPVVYGREHSGVSKSRPEEVKAVTEGVKQILAVSPESTIGVITFYSAQEKLLEESIYAALNEEQRLKVEIGTVDAFQGKEFDFVLLSCVRSNEIKDDEQKSVGFLMKPNRICVALSRAKKQMSVFADAETMNQVPQFKTLYDWCKNGKGGYYREY